MPVLASGSCASCLWPQD